MVLYTFMSVASDASMWRYRRRSCYRSIVDLISPTQLMNECRILRVPTDRVPPQRLFYAPNGDGTAISLWSSESYVQMPVMLCRLEIIKGSQMNP